METFKDVISGDQLVLVDFFATWCQPCKMMHPILEQVKEVLGDRIRIIKAKRLDTLPVEIYTEFSDKFGADVVSDMRIRNAVSYYWF